MSVPEPVSANPILVKAGCAGHHRKVAALLAEGADPNLPDTYGHYSLHLAAGWGSAASVEMLICAGAKPEVRDDAGDTPFLKAIRREDLEPARVLARHGASVNVCNHQGETALGFTACWGLVEHTRFLLEAGRRSMPARVGT